MKRMDWSAIRADYVKGADSLRSLARKHGASFHSLQRLRAVNHGLLNGA
jgi:hypothetical protein